MPLFFIDYWYVILVIPAVLISLFAQMKVKSTYSKYSRVMSSRGLTGYDAAQIILRSNGVGDVDIRPIRGQLTDNFDPRTKTVNLSEGVYGSSSVAALGIAAHEAGHACQHAENYGPIKLRNAILPVARIGSNLAMPLIFIGMIFYGAYFSDILVTLGVLFYGAAVVFQLVTLPVEFNASSRALKALDENGALRDEELLQTKKVLSAAAMTYVAAMLVSLMSFLRILLLTSGRRRK